MDTYMELFDRLVKELCNIYGELVISIILYGSVARGMQTDESDIDIAILLKEGQTEKMYDAMLDLIVDLELEYDKVLSVLRIDYTNFTTWENTLPFYKNVKKDGVVLWPAA